jgi:hypothetical protein
MDPLGHNNNNMLQFYVWQSLIKKQIKYYLLIYTNILKLKSLFVWTR